MGKRIFALIYVSFLILIIISCSNINSVFADKPNKVPVADAGGPYSGTEGTAISFDGSASYDPDGTIVSYYWDFGDGFNSTEQNPTHIYTEDGTYTVSLTVTDNGGTINEDDNEQATDEDAVSAVITDLNPEAEFYASSTYGIDSLTVAFYDNSTSYDGILSWLWEFGDGENSTEKNPTHLFTVGSYTITLTVSEKDGDTSTQTKPNYINIEHAPNTQPTADFIPSSTTSTINQIILFTDKSKDKDGNIISWFWNFGDKTTSTIQNPSHKYQKQGKYQITLIVADNEGARDSITKTITILELEPPVTSHNYDGLWHNTDFTINLTASDNHSRVAETYYRINNGPIQEISIHGQPQITTESNNNTLEYWSIDTSGNEEQHHTLSDIKLDKSPPKAKAGEDITINEDTPIILDALNSTDNIQITKYAWTIFDNNLQQIQEKKTNYTFQTPGMYIVTLKVTDAALNSDTDTINITVLDRTNPNPYAGEDKVIPQQTRYNFNASASTDNVGVVSYIWTFTDKTQQTLIGPNPTYIFNNPGLYEINLTVWDQQGNFANDTLLITVIDNTLPIADAGPDQVIDQNIWIQLNASESTDNIAITRYLWTFTDGDKQELEGMIVDYYLDKPGTYPVTLTVYDAQGNSSNDTLSIIVRNISTLITDQQSDDSEETNNDINLKSPAPQEHILADVLVVAVWTTLVAFAIITFREKASSTN